MFKNFDLNPNSPTCDVVYDVTYDSTTYTITSNSTSYDVTYYKASTATNTGIYYNIKNYLYGQTGSDPIKSLYSSNTGYGCCIFAIGSTYMGNKITVSSFTGLLATVSGASTTSISLIDWEDSDTTSSQNTLMHRGKIVDRTTTASTTALRTYGDIFYNFGLVVLHGLDYPSTGAASGVANNCISGLWFGYGTYASISAYASASAGAVGIASIAFTSQEKQSSQIFFIRAMNKEFNYSTNPTAHNDYGSIIGSLTADPTTYITGIGLYNDQNECLATVKVSPPIKKDFNSEALIKAMLTY